MKVTIPYKPRYPQGDIHKQLESHRFSVLVAHRRMGKTVLAVNHLLKRAITDGKERGFYAYIAPYRVQAEQIAWGYLKHFTGNIPLVKFNEQKLQVTLPNGANIRITGADNPDSLRGLYFDGVVIDEVAQVKPELWTEIVRPALADRLGWAVFLGTPKGINLFSQLYDQALKLQKDGNPDWIAMLYSVDQTNAIAPAELEALKAEMSDNEFRQEFMCDFAAAADNALISIDLVRQAVTRTYAEHEYQHAPLVYGVDVARFGSDATVIFKRRGLVAFEPIVMRKMDSMSVADTVARHAAKDKPDAIFIDAGRGEGVIDRLRQLNFNVTEVPFGGSASDADHYVNRRVEMWDEMRKWLQSGGAIPPDVILQSDLCAPTYGFNPAGKKLLESKDKIKERLGRSVDYADSLALTFAAPVAPTIDRHLERQLYGDIDEPYNPDEAFDLYWRG